MDYKAAGVDVEAGYESVKRISGHAKRTFRSEVLSGLGGFSGLFSIAKAKDMLDPVLSSSTDGVGTKLKLAFLSNEHGTVGIDLVAMCVNDLICIGAEPLFMLDYIANGKTEPIKIEQIVKGIADGCVLANTSLVGGETAEMPGFYQDGEYDLAGCAVGLVDRQNIIDGRKIQAGDSLIGIASSGLHSNGYSLVRKILLPDANNIHEYVEELGCELIDELLKPTKIYVRQILELIKKVEVKGISNITGGGFIENIPRVIPDGLCACVKRGTWGVPGIFELLRKRGNVDEKAMFNTFNMGIGMVLAVAKNDAGRTLSELASMGETAWEIGSVEASHGGDSKIVIKGLTC